MAHHTAPNGDTYVDTAFINGANAISGVTVHHMGFGEFYAETPRGRVDFDRMRGKDFPGQSGRSHLLQGNAGRSSDVAVEWLLKQMEQKGKSERMASSNRARAALRSGLVRLASQQPPGSTERKALLAMLSK